MIVAGKSAFRVNAVSKVLHVLVVEFSLLFLDSLGLACFYHVLLCETAFE